VHELEGLLLASTEAVSGRTLYVGDYPPVNAGDMAERIRDQLDAPPIRSLPLGALRVAARAGDALRRLGWSEPPLTSFRLRNLITEMVFDLSPLAEIVGPLPYSVDAGIGATVAWMRSAGEL
jgi:nucleoside-diphosphate-sugar epimerase